MASSAVRDPSALALVLLAQACTADPTHDDAGSSAPDAVVCGDVTPIDQFDALVPRILAAFATQPEHFPSSRDTYDRYLAYTRARVASGAVVIDPSRVDACLARLATFGGVDGSFVSSGSPCPDVFRPRCTAGTGARCGTDIDCDLSDFCDQSHQTEPCERSGHCVPRVPLGGACARDCVVPDTGAVACVTNPRESEDVCVALTSRLSTTVGSPCDQLVLGADGFLSVMQGCAAPLVCVLTGDPSQQVLSCGTPTPPGSVPDGGWCVVPSDCVAGSTCDVGQTCAPIPATCPGDGCPNGFACAEGTCVATDGSPGAPCEEHAFHSDCAIGLACGSDSRCGPLLADGAMVDSSTPGECASMCASVTIDASGAVIDQRCAPLAP